MKIEIKLKGVILKDPNYMVKCQNKGELDSPSGENLKNVLV